MSMLSRNKTSTNQPLPADDYPSTIIQVLRNMRGWIIACANSGGGSSVSLGVSNG